ncbi:MAG: aldehyde dehydrogenase [Phycisphaeraceae bacterium]|nr:aldehyde dehydrogenase [Phycisphaeraceae bacterium]
MPPSHANPAHLTLLNYIGGRFVPAASGQTLPVEEPATARVYATTPDSGPEDINAAADAALGAFPAWRALPSCERAAYLLRLADLIDETSERLAHAESRDTGKPISLARRVDIPRAAANLRYFANAVQHASGEFHDFDGGGIPGGRPAINYTLRRPRGVAGCISPWNLPLYLLTWKIAPALATGNTVVAKPSEVTPATASLLCELAAQAGLPPGVLNIVHGGGPTAGAALVQHPRVPTITFTGSTGVGRWIAGAAGTMLKRVSLELGGKNPFIIFDDAPIEDALDTAARAAFTNQGQICLCGSRVLVHESRFEEAVRGLARRARALRVGDPADDATQFGALTSAPHLAKVAKYVERAAAQGGVLHCGGARTPAADLPARCADGWFYQPTVISGLSPACDVEQEEIFGPVVTLQPFRDEAQALRLANGTPYGLAATIFTQDLSRAHRVAEALHAGIVWINCWMVRDLRTPFGGMKESGVGREGGAEALRFFTEPKNVCVGL